MKICKIGGQAVMEGVMMKSEKGLALSVRNPEGEIITEYTPGKSKIKKGTFTAWPIVRGVIAFVESLTVGMTTLSRSAVLAGEDVNEEPSKFEKFLSETLGKSVESVIIALAAVLSLALSVGLFIFLPTLTGDAVYSTFSVGEVWRCVIEGISRLVIFFLYIVLCSRIKDVKRVFMYHGAEHKTIACYEAEKELTVENARTMTRLHPRCGTNYLFLVMAVSILFYTMIDLILPFKFEGALNIVFRLVSRLIFLPIVAGVSYEVLQGAAKGESRFARIVRAPGLALQHITTKEPTDDMLEVAIASFKTCISHLEDASDATCDGDACKTTDGHTVEKNDANSVVADAIKDVAGNIDEINAE